MIKRISTTAALIMLFIVTATTQDIQTKRPVFSLEACYTGDFAGNLSGGKKTGYAYLGMANFFLGINLEDAGLWKGARIFLNGANTHGNCPTEVLFGDVQAVSNIEAGNHTYIQELWYKQSVGKFEFTAGLQDLNVEFANSEYGTLFINSSFGIAPTLSHNFAAPIFPLTALGLTAKWNITDQSTWMAAVYEGSPANFSESPYNTYWRFDAGEGLAAITEVQHRITIATMPGTLKLGMFRHNHNHDREFTGTTLGFYAHADQQIWKNRFKALGLFSQVGYSPSESAFTDYYFSLGAGFSGFLYEKGTDNLGIAVAHESFNAEIKSETVVELSYQHQLTENIFIQPDIQYIINPAGSEAAADHCLAGIVRVGVGF